MSEELKFTGNWFIDAGILGFVRLMEDVYGDIWENEWKKKSSNKPEGNFNFLEYLNKKIQENKELVYYGYFPFGYFAKNLKVSLSKEFVEKFISEVQREKNGKDIFEKTWSFIDKFSKDPWINNRLSKLDKLSKIEELADDVKDIKNLLEELNSKKDDLKKLYPKKKKIATISDFDRLIERIEKSNHNLSEEFRLLVEKIREKEKRIRERLATLWDKKDINSSFFRIPIAERFFINFLIFQTSERYTYSQQKEDLLNIIEFDLMKREILRKFDRTLNKFLASNEEMPNIFYTTPLNMKNLKEKLPYFCVYVLCFPLAFITFNGIYYLFYSSDLNFSYLVNKRLRLFINKKEGDILKMTYKAIIDTLIEYKSVWSLEDMYIISHRGISRETQEMQNVNYIGIPKLQASILLDDRIRENLNKNIQFRSENFKGDKYCWLIEEFIKGKPLCPIILNHVSLVLNENNIKLSSSLSLYSLITDAKILEFKAKKENESLFSENYFDNYRALVSEIKKEIRDTSFKASLINQITKDRDTKERIVRELLSALKARNKNEFLNILLKNLNQEKKLATNDNLNRWIFEKIVKNDISFERYGLVLVMYLLR